jgi:membrane associated rhomboid family serine protease
VAWQGWGAGPAGAGSRGPSRAFLVVATLGAAAVTVALALDRDPVALVAGAATAWFGLRAAGRIRPRDPT